MRRVVREVMSTNLGANQACMPNNTHGFLHTATYTRPQQKLHEVIQLYLYLHSVHVFALPGHRSSSFLLGE